MFLALSLTLLAEESCLPLGIYFFTWIQFMALCVTLLQGEPVLPCTHLLLIQLYPAQTHLEYHIPKPVGTRLQEEESVRKEVARILMNVLPH